MIEIQSRLLFSGQRSDVTSDGSSMEHRTLTPALPHTQVAFNLASLPSGEYHFTARREAVDVRIKMPVPKIQVLLLPRGPLLTLGASKLRAFSSLTHVATGSDSTGPAASTSIPCFLSSASCPLDHFRSFRANRLGARLVPCG